LPRMSPCRQAEFSPKASVLLKPSVTLIIVVFAVCCNSPLLRGSVVPIGGRATLRTGAYSTRHAGKLLPASAVESAENALDGGRNNSTGWPVEDEHL